MCTIDRVREPERFLRSLLVQKHKNFELIIVDQNTDGRLSPLVERYKDTFPVRLLNSRPGLSRARNVALQHVQGDVVGFPDDDCWYSAELLEGVCRRFESHPEWDALSVGRASDENAEMVPEGIIPLSRFNLWGRVPSICLFLRRAAMERTGGFDESLGVGAGTPWGAGEDTDYVLRSMKLGATWVHDPSLRVFHAPSPKQADANGRPRARAYACGLGRVLRKNGIPFWMVLGGCFLSVKRALAALIRGKPLEARWHFETLLGRIGGWLGRTPAVDRRNPMKRGASGK